MLSDRTKFSLAAATIAASATLMISPAEAISFRFTSLPSCTLYSAVGLVFPGTDCSARPGGIASIFVGDINGSTVTGGVGVGNTRLGDVGSGYYFGGSYVSPIPSGQGEFLFRVQGDALSMGVPPRANIYVLSFICNLGTERSCNGARGSFAIREFSTVMMRWDIEISDFSWSNALSLPPFPAPNTIPTPETNPASPPTPAPIDTPNLITTSTPTPETASIPEPSSVAGLLLLGGVWLWRRKWKQIFLTGISESLN